MTIVSLTGKSRIDAAFKSGRRFGSPEAAMIATHGKPTTDMVELLIVVRKKVARKSVVRNRVRRLVREALRRQLGEMEKQNAPVPVQTIIILWNSAPSRPSMLRLESVSQILRPLIERACGVRRQ